MKLKKWPKIILLTTIVLIILVAAIALFINLKPKNVKVEEIKILNTNRNYEKKQNRKESRLALKSALSYKADKKEITVLEKLEVKKAKTKEFIKLLDSLKFGQVRRFCWKPQFEELTVNFSSNFQNLTLLQ